MKPMHWLIVNSVFRIVISCWLYHNEKNRKQIRTNAGMQTHLQVNHELNESLTVVNLLHGDGA